MANKDDYGKDDDRRSRVNEDRDRIGNSDHGSTKSDEGRTTDWLKQGDDKKKK